MTVATGAVVVGVGMAAMAVAMGRIGGMAVVVRRGAHGSTIAWRRRKLLHRRRAGRRAALPQPVQVEAGELDAKRAILQASELAAAI